MRIHRILVTALALAALGAALPAAASAALPSTNLPFLAPNEGIGGANLHARIVKGKQAWGRGTCTDFNCSYTDPRRFDLGSASFDYEDGPRGKITSMRIRLGTNSRGRFVFRSPLAAFRSDKFIHLGSTQRAVKAAYPAAKTVRGATGFLTLRARDGDTTIFEFFENRLVGVSMMDDRPRG